MAKIIKAPDSISSLSGFKVFLAGSIEMGTVWDWQYQVGEALSKTDIIIFNPRRNDWDSSWVQSKDNPQFREQVEWELSALEEANIIAMYFDPNSKSPISLLELGLFARTGKLIVCCSENYWRKGNVDIVCEKYLVRQVNNLDELVDRIKKAKDDPFEFVPIQYIVSRPGEINWEGLESLRS
jgi:hypothetical protein